MNVLYKNRDILEKVFLFLVLVVCLTACLFLVFFMEFDYDEFQHLHITWNVKNGKILYKDFFEHHGPVFPLFNGLVYNQFDLERSIGTMFFFKAVSMFYIVIILYLTYLIGRLFLGSSIGGLYSAIILSSLSFFQQKGTEVRPDVLQTVFWLLGTYLILSDLKLGDKRKLFLAGLSYGMVILSTSKGAIGPFSVFVFLLLIGLFKKLDAKEIFYGSLVILAGISSVFAFFSVYFLLNNAFTEFFYYNFIFNIIVIFYHHSNTNFSELSGFLIESHFYFILSSFTGIVIIGYKME